MKSAFFCLNRPEEHNASTQCLPDLLIKTDILDDSTFGRNTCLVRTGGLRVREIYDCLPGKAVAVPEGLPLYLDFQFFTGEQREKRALSMEGIAGLLNRDLSQISRLQPLLLVIPYLDRLLVFRYLTEGKRGSLFVKVYETPLPNTERASRENVLEAVKDVQARLIITRRSLNNKCWYSKWNADYEMERKYTFQDPVDTWKMAVLLKRKIESGQFNDYILEFNDEFQVWDFDIYMFEIIRNGKSDGYISYIPQANGKFTVKLKTFSADCEIRKEMLNAHQEVCFADLISHTQKLVGSSFVQFAPFRRKRFDINLESIRSGNVFGIFFDLCRPIGETQSALCQCEVEYLRSRTFEEVHDVREEFEEVCNYTREFILLQENPFTEGYLSKLTYLRDYCQKR